MHSFMIRILATALPALALAPALPALDSVVSGGAAPSCRALAAGQLSTYGSDRFGFSVSWPGLDWTVRESDNGDGITVKDGKGFIMKAWGSNDAGVLGIPLDGFLESLRGRFRKIGTERVSRRSGEVLLEGTDERGKRLVLLGFWNTDRTIVLEIGYPPQRAATCRPHEEAILANFLPAGHAGEGVRPVLDAACATGMEADLPPLDAMYTVSGGEQGDLFLLQAREPADITFHSAQLNEKTGRLEPGARLSGFRLERGETGAFRTMVPEGAPGIMVCASGMCWAPSFSGLDGSLVGAEGFRAVPAVVLLRKAGRG